MLNISKNSINKFINLKDYKVFTERYNKGSNRIPLYTSIALLCIAFAALFIPWTQNISAKGYVTTLKPNQKPQAIQSVISGKLEKWYVREGDFVQAGDTIVFLSEIKSEYFDPELVQRTSEQVEAKLSSMNSYGAKVKSLENQYNALVQAKKLKLQQTRNKIEQTKLKLKSDSLDLIAYQADAQIAQNQVNRAEELFNKGLKSLTYVEGKRLKVQETTARVSVQKNKLLEQKNVILNLRIELPAIESEYADKLAKAQSDKFSALSNKLDASATSSKLKNQLSNYSARQQFYHVVAPQSGYITKAVKKGLGEIIKEGTDIITIMPEDYDLAIEVYVRPRDLPLLTLGNNVQILFDGWPAITFSGWPDTSFGTFTGDIVAIDQFISDNGMYRILVAPNDAKKPWPNLVRVGSGSKAFILLNDVPFWYELWRQLNGFPPDFYDQNDEDSEKVKRKAPIKSFK